MGLDRQKAIDRAMLDAAARYDVAPSLIKAIIGVENAPMDPFAVRYEAHVMPVKAREFAKANKISEASEIQLQKFSFGLMQILGTTARNLGFKGPLPQLCDIELNINFGTLLLAKLAKRYSMIDDVVASYNAGSPRRLESGLYKNQPYVDKVMRLLSRES